MSSEEAFLVFWSGAGIAWWLISSWLVASNTLPLPAQESNANSAGCQLLSIFKPLPQLGAAGISSMAAGLETFISQMDKDSELLLGIHEPDREATNDFVNEMRAKYPSAFLNVIYRAEPDSCANPKIAWLKLLAPHARGELWFWSDADIIAPPGFLSSVRREFAQGGVEMLTFPYVVKKVPRAPSILDALFVNVELYPGVLLLRKRGPVDFGLGAGMLFPREKFLVRVKWEELGAALADDFVLGQRFKPVLISATTVETVADVATWREALEHYLRWSKTIRWNRPVGTAARILVLPVAGWLALVLLHPNSATAWLGLLVMTQIDVAFAGLICRQVGCRWSFADLVAIEFWSVWRVLVWFACWLPWPVVWRGRVWHGPRAAQRPGQILGRH